MTTRNRSRRSVARASKRVMLWFNNGLDMTTLGATSSVTVPLLIAGVVPNSYLHGLTILRLILKITYSSLATLNTVNALAAYYVGTRGSAGTPPDLNADLANYYYFTGLQQTNEGDLRVKTELADIRTKRIIRGEDTDLFFRCTNNGVVAMQVGMECRMLLALK